MKTMTPSDECITNGEVAKIQDLLGAALRKSGLKSEPTQQAIEKNGKQIALECVAVVRKYAEMFCNLFVRIVKVLRNRTPEQVLDATGRKQYTDKSVVAHMPKGNGEEVEVVFFNLGHSINDTDLDAEYENRGLKPADAYSLSAVNEEDPAFADTKPNCTHWKDADGNWCYMAFGQWHDGVRNVHVGRSYYDDWGDGWWFAGLRK